MIWQELIFYIVELLAASAHVGERVQQRASCARVTVARVECVASSAVHAAQGPLRACSFGPFSGAS